MSEEGLEAAKVAMAEQGVAERAIDVFSYYYRQLEAGATGTVSEDDVDPLTDPPKLSALSVSADDAREALGKTAIIKLNGGLGTSMGMDRAKSLLEVSDGLSFLDVIVRQVLAAREQYDVSLPLLFMDSFRTRADTLEALAPYPELEVEGLGLDFLQNREPKLRTDDLTPVSWPADPALEWCPPGHGDLYTALEVSGVLASLLAAGFAFVSVSNSDNLGAKPDAELAAWFAATGAPYAAEVCRRTPADRKGGHLVVRKSDGQLVLRDSAQVRKQDEDAYQDIEKHPFFHCNNLWFDLRQVSDSLAKRDGVLGLPLIRNVKTVDPGDPSSPEVVQIETAMGAAIEVFEGARAVEVPRSRFVPVKTTNDLLLLRSDVYAFAPDFSLVGAGDDAPLVQLEPSYYKLVHDFEAHFPDGVPSMSQARSLTVHGEWTFGAGVAVRGDAELPDRGTASTVEAGSVLGG